MTRQKSRTKLVMVIVLGLALAGAGAVAWWQRTPLLCWYYMDCLSRANEADREVCAERVLSLNEAGVAALVEGLAQPDPTACANIGAAIALLSQRWGPDEPRWHDLAARLADEWERASPAGRHQCLLVLTAAFDSIDPGQEPAPALARAAGQALGRAALSAEADVHAAARALAEKLLESACPPEALGDCRALVQASLRSDNPVNRAAAVRLSVHPDLGLLEQAMPLLHDPNAEVRREAMTAARLAPETVVKTDELLPWLHDSDEDVRRLCEAVLTMRGMTRDQIRLGRMLTDEDSTVRLGVLEELGSADDLEPGVWLRLLSIDPEPAVRVAAVRFASDHPLVDLSDRIDQMAQSDPSPTVRQLAQSYLKLPPARKSPR